MNNHSGDCTIYASLDNGSPTDGICTCGYGLQRLREGDGNHMLSNEKALVVALDRLKRTMITEEVELL